MFKHIKKIGVLIVGGIFILLGLLGLVLPVLQGFLFLAIGLVLISLYSPAIQKRTEKYRKRYPKFHATMEKIEAWVASVIGRP